MYFFYRDTIGIELFVGQGSPTYYRYIGIMFMVYGKFLFVQNEG